MSRVVLHKYQTPPFFPSWPGWLTGFFFPSYFTGLFHSFRTRKDQLTLERHNRSTHHRPQLLMKPSARGILPLHNYPAALSPWATHIRLPTPWEAACKWVPDAGLWFGGGMPAAGVTCDRYNRTENKQERNVSCHSVIEIHFSVRWQMRTHSSKSWGLSAGFVRCVVCITDTPLGNRLLVVGRHFLLQV